MDRIAIIGLACRFPGAANAREYWQLLRSGAHAITRIPRSRFDFERLGDSTPGTPGKLDSPWGGFIEGIDLFDAEFFEVAPADARSMDPQQRLALEVAWEALEDAGQPPVALRGTAASVFLGVHTNEYSRLARADPSKIDLTAVTGGSRNGVAGRISYAFGLEGPSMTVDSDRSSSLVAVHLACQSLRSGDATLAIAGGTNLVLSSEVSLALSRAGMLAPDGLCKFGDAKADGTVRSDGIGLVVLKPLAAAERDGDRIYAVIRGSAVHHDGGRSGDLMAPSSASQCALLRAAYRNAGVSPEDVQYVEAHGTGTVVGDPVEVEAIASVLRPTADGRGPIRIGSVKTNIGHAEAAAGIAGLIKVVLALSQGEIPASLHFKSPNPRIRFGPVVVQTEIGPWPDAPKGRLAGVTSLGLTGTNAHVVLAEAPASSVGRALEPATRPVRPELLALSARNRESLVAIARAYVAQLRREDRALFDVAYTATLRRSHLEDRLAVVGESCEELARELESFAATGEGAALTSGPDRVRKAVFVFPGQGSQWLGMGRELLEQEPVFRTAIEDCDRAIAREAGWSLLEELTAPAERSRLNQVDVVQPALFAVGVSLAAIWRSWGIEPSAVVGHSQGEVAAAYVAGALTLDEAVSVVCRRSRLLARLSGQGEMAIVELSATEAKAAIAEHERLLSIAAINSSRSTLLSGSPAAMGAVLTRLEARGVFGRRVNVSYASHSPSVDPILDECVASLAGLTSRLPRVPMRSTVTGALVGEGELTASYWANNLRQPVCFAEAVEALLLDGHDAFIEMSPHPLLVPALDDLRSHAKHGVLVVGSLRRAEPERRALLRSLGELYARGFDVAWKALFPRPGAVVALPSYAWRHRRYWHTEDNEPPTALEQHASAGAHPRSPFLTQLMSASPARRRELVVARVARDVAKVLGSSSSEMVDVQRPFRELGLTSLRAVELRNTLARTFERSFPPTLLFTYPNVLALTEHLAGQEEPGAPTGLLGEILVDLGLLAETELKLALTEQARAGGHERLGTVLQRLGFVSAEQLQGALARQLAEPIAIIGMACRFPGGVESPEAFWQLLRAGVDAIVEVPRERWDVDALYDPELAKVGKMCTRWGGFLDRVDEFDAAFFGISPREAVDMDPRQRLLLEVSWEAIERAGMPADSLLGSRSGVFLGIMNNDDYAALKRLSDDPSRVRSHHGTGTATSVAAGRLAYALGLHGPAMAIDTACSSSLVAVHQAMQSLRAGECRMALAGGVNTILSPELTLSYSLNGMLSPEGRCKTFDASADGYVRSEGCGIVVMKRLSDAIANGDHVLALLKGSAINQDGRTSGLTAPSGLAQQAVVREALAGAAVLPSQVSYVEAHGTGTPLGDPIEIQALGEVFKDGRSSAEPLRVGSVKTNLGHMEAAAGIGGLMKVVLALRHETVPAHLHLKSENPMLGLEKLPCSIPTHACSWEGSAPRIAGVSSFGFSGTNAHVVVCEAPRQMAAPPAPARAAELVVLSAKSPQALTASAARLAAHLDAHPEQELASIAYSLATTRTHHAHRLAMAVSSRAGLSGALEAVTRGEQRTGTVRGEARSGKLAWLFTGQGAQELGMGRGLWHAWPVFREAIERAWGAIDRYLGEPLRDIMWGEEAARLDQTAYTQPALFALEVALAALWHSWGVEPDLLAGHSIGELSAAHIAGVFSLEDAARLVVARGRLMQALPQGGAMVAIAASEAIVAAAIAPHAAAVSIAAVNGPQSMVLSGEEGPVLAIADHLAKGGVRTKRLAVSHAFHSPLMDAMLDPFRRVAESVAYRAAERPMISNLSGALAGPEISTADYWVSHVRRTVRFADGIRALEAAGVTRYAELGPKPVLVGQVPACASQPQEPTLLASLRPPRPDSEVMLEALGGYHAAGGAVDWNAVSQPGSRRVELPTYPWQRKRYWIEPSMLPSRGGEATGHPLLGTRVPLASAGSVYESVLSLHERAWLGELRVAGEAHVPVAALAEILRAAAEQQYEGERAEVIALVLQAPVVLPEQGGQRLQVALTEERGGFAASIASRPAHAGAGVPWTLHATARVRRTDSALPPRLDLAATRTRCARGDQEAVVDVELPEDTGDVESYDAHPALLHAALQALAGLTSREHLYLPCEIERLTVHEAGAISAVVHVRRTGGGSAPESFVTGDVTLTDAHGHVFAEVLGLKLRRADAWAPTRVRVGAAVPTAQAIFQLRWSQVRSAPQGVLASGRWAVVARDGDRVAKTLAEKLRATGRECTHVPLGELGGELARLQAENVVCVWGSSDAEVSTAALELASAGLSLVQAFANQSHASRLWWVTARAVAVTNDEAPDVAFASLWGLGRTVMKEHPELGCTLVDVEPVPGAAEVIFGELVFGDDEREIAWRNGARSVARLVRALDGARDEELRPRALRADSTVLITGGLGGVGIELARCLAQRGVKHLVLTGRRGKESPGAAAVVSQLEGLGAVVTVAGVDVADRAALERVLAAIPAQLPLRGVIHAAGVRDVGMLKALTPERLANVMRPKIAGAIHLDALTREADLDFFVLFSSIAGTFGSEGQGPYAAANASLDALAAARRARGLHAQSLAWGPWDEVGMSVAIDPTRRARLARQGWRPHSRSEGIALFESVLCRPEAALVLAPLDLRAVKTASAGAVEPIWRALLRVRRRAAPAHGRWGEEILALPPDRRIEAILEVVRVEVAAALALPDPGAVPADRPFKELGFDSFMAVELRTALGRRAGMRLPTTLAFDYPTAAAVAQFVLETLRPNPANLAPPSEPSAPRAPSALALEDVARLSDEEAIARFKREMGR
jgi:acyl transferase domain-containing protein